MLSVEMTPYSERAAPPKEDRKPSTGVASTFQNRSARQTKREIGLGIGMNGEFERTGMREQGGNKKEFAPHHYN